MTDLVDIAKYVLDADSAALDRFEQLVKARREAIRAEEVFIKEQSIYVGTRLKMRNSVIPKKLRGRIVIVRELLPDGEMMVEQVEAMADGRWHRFRTTPNSVEILQP